MCLAGASIPRYAAQVLNVHNELANHLLSHRIAIVLVLHWNYLSHKVKIPPKSSNHYLRIAWVYSYTGVHCTFPLGDTMNWLSRHSIYSVVEKRPNFIICFYIGTIHFQGRRPTFVKKEGNVVNNTTSEFQTVTALSIIWRSLDTKVCFSLDSWW